MLPQNFINVLQNQCAICAVTFREDESRAIKLQVLTSEGESNNLDELFNIELLSYIYRISTPKLSHNLLNNLKNVIPDEDYISASSFLQDSSSTREIRTTVCLCLCELCAPKLAELYVVHNNFVKSLALDSFISVAIKDTDPAVLPIKDVQSNSSHDLPNHNCSLTNENEKEIQDDVVVTSPTDVKSEITLDELEEEYQDDVNLPSSDANSESEQIIQDIADPPESPNNRKQSETPSGDKNDGKFKCPECSKSYTRMDRLRNHCREIHKYPYYYGKRKRMNTSDDLPKNRLSILKKIELEVKKKTSDKIESRKIPKNTSQNLKGDENVPHEENNEDNSSSDQESDKKFNTKDKDKHTPAMKNTSSEKLMYTLRTRLARLSGHPHYCPISGCEKQTRTFYKMKCHCAAKHKVKIVYYRDPEKSYCEVCKIPFDTLMDFQIHWKKLHSNANELESVKHCHRCKINFLSESELNQHGLDVHLPQLIISKCIVSRKTLIRCLRCKYTFKDLKTLKNHENTFHKPTSLRLKNTNISKGQKFLLYHGIIKGPPYSCPKCSNSFAEIESLKTHCLRLHLLLIPDQKNENPTYINVSCLECSQLVLNMKCLSKHYRSSHNLWFMCVNCRKAFSEQNLLDVHECKEYSEQILLQSFEESEITNELKSEASAKRVVFCSYCDKSFESASEYNSHVSEQHQSEIENIAHIKCPKCLQQCSSELVLQVHLRCHSPNFPSTQCEFCDKKFKAIGNLMTHKNSYHRRELVLPLVSSTCTVCNRAFKRAADLKEHLNTKHASVRPYECEICQMRFKDPKTLKKHKVIHSDNKRHKCSQCDMSFHAKNVLKNHLMIHFDQRPFVCETCGKSFRRKSALKDHYVSHDKGAKFFFCDKCGKGMKTMKYLKGHMRRCQPDLKPKPTPAEELSGPHQCPECGKMLKHLRSLRLHMNWKHSDNPKNKHDCSLCEKSFRGRARLKTHIAQRHNGEEYPDPEVIKVPSEGKNDDVEVEFVREEVVVVQIPEADIMDE